MPKTTVVTTVQDEAAMNVLRQKCVETDSRLVVSDYTMDASKINYAVCPWNDEYTSYTHARAGQIKLGALRDIPRLSIPALLYRV